MSWGFLATLLSRLEAGLFPVGWIWNKALRKEKEKEHNLEPTQFSSEQLHLTVTCPMEMDFLGSLPSVISLARRLATNRLSVEMTR